MTKRETSIYRYHGIEVQDGKLVSPIGLINPVLKEGNTKVGKKVWTFSTLPTNKLFETEFGVVAGTCPCTCKGGYCQAGHYHRANVKRSMAINTVLAYKWPNWLFNAIIAQLEINGDCLVRIHATGEFFDDAYAEMWCNVVEIHPGCKFWTYTKVDKYVDMFDKYENANIVHSVIPEIGFNYGHAGYVLDAYNALLERGESVHICPCGVDDTQHCEDCTGCSTCKWVLFLEHSTEYVAKDDPLYPAVEKIVRRLR